LFVVRKHAGDSGTCFGFGGGLGVRESILNAEMRDSFGIRQLSGELGEKRKCSMTSVRAGRPVAVGEFVCILVSPECSRGRGDSHGVVWCLMGGYDVLVDDIYSCHYP